MIPLGVLHENHEIRFNKNQINITKIPVCWRLKDVSFVMLFQFSENSNMPIWFVVMSV